MVDKPTISVSKKELPLAKPVESSSESYLSGSENAEGRSNTERIGSREENETVLVDHEKTEKVFITQHDSGSFTGGSKEETFSKKEKEEPKLETSSDVPTKIVKEKQEDLLKNEGLDDSKTISTEQDDTSKEKSYSTEKLGNSNTFPSEIVEDTDKNVSPEIAKTSLDLETTEDQRVVDRKESVKKDEDDVAAVEVENWSPRSSATPIPEHVISEILGSSKSINKDLAEKKSSCLQDGSKNGGALSVENFKRPAVEEDMVCESVDAMTTDRDHEKEIVTIRVEVDDEFEPELITQHSVEKLKGSVNDSCHGQQRSSTSKTVGSDDVMPKIHFRVENQSTVSSSLLTPGSKEAARSGKSLNDISASTGSFGRSPSWNAERQSKMEKLMNEELDVHPSIRSVSPALGFTRSMVAACFDEVDEEGEGEKEAENGAKGSTKGGSD